MHHYDVEAAAVHAHAHAAIYEPLNIKEHYVEPLHIQPTATTTHYTHTEASLPIEHVQEHQIHDVHYVREPLVTRTTYVKDPPLHQTEYVREPSLAYRYEEPTIVHERAPIYTTPIAATHEYTTMAAAPITTHHVTRHELIPEMDLYERKHDEKMRYKLEKHQHKMHQYERTAADFESYDDYLEWKYQQKQAKRAAKQKHKQSKYDMKRERKRLKYERQMHHYAEE